MPVGGSDPVHTTTGNDQDGHDADFKRYITGQQSTLKDAVEQKLKDVSGETGKEMTEQMGLTM